MKTVLFFLLTSLASAQFYTISTIAGIGRISFAGGGEAAVNARLIQPAGVAADSAGNVFISDNYYQQVFKVTSAGIISIYAGSGQPGFSGDGGPATSAMLSHPQGVKMDKSGNLFITDNYNHRIRKVSQNTITTFAGNGTNALQGDGGRATSASLHFPTDIAIDPNGIVFIADATNTRIRRVDANGFITTFAGGGSSTVNGPALQAFLAVPTAITLDSQGNIIIPLAYTRQVRRITLQQTINTIAGASPASGQGDGGLAASASLLDPFGIAVDSTGNIYVSDQADNRVRKITPGPNRTISTYGGNGQFGGTGDRGPATNAQIGYPRAAGLDPAGNLYITSPVGAVVRRITPTGTITTFAGGASIGFTGDGGQAALASLNIPLGVGGDSQGNVYVSDTGNARIRQVDSGGIIRTIAGTGVEGYTGDNGVPLNARLYQPHQLAIDAAGNIFFTDTDNHRIRKVVVGNSISTVAGTGENGFTGDGGLATAAQVGSPGGLAIDTAGNLYVGTGNRIRKIDAATGKISTIAGTGADGFSGDGGLATLATMNVPVNLAVDGSGNVYFTDSNNQRVRQLTPVQIVREGVANGATLLAGGVSPGEIVTIYAGIPAGPAAGQGLQIDPTFGRVATIIAGVQALFDGVPAPLTFVNAGQINAIVPYSVSGKATTQLQVIISGKQTNTVTLPVVPSSPGVFAITNSDGSVNTAANPSADSAFVIYGTGEGDTTPTVPNGTVNNSVFPKPNLPVTAEIGGQPATVLYAGAAPGFVAGVLQVNLQAAAGVSGTVPLKITIGTASTPPGLTVSVRPR